jgi:hypothetical protein
MCVLDKCLYYMWHQFKRTLTLLSVDDMVVASNKDFDYYLKETKAQQFCSRYEMTELVVECKKYQQPLFIYWHQMVVTIQIFSVAES